MIKKRYKTIIVSDIHLGTAECKLDEVMHFLEHTECDKLILNGDIIDIWYLRMTFKWRKHHFRFIRLLLRWIEKGDREIVYIRGNHDDLLDDILPIDLEKFKILNEYVHETSKGKYLVIHGDGFDVVSRYYRWLEILGSIGYVTLLKINRYYNAYRKWRGKEYFSLSKRIKAKVKRKVNEISNLEHELEKIAKRKECQGVICGHTHITEDKMLGDIHYLNSGDWVESMTALVEEEDGTIHLLEYKDFRKEILSA